MNFRGRVCETKIFFCTLERMDGVNGEISMNPNKCRLYTIVLLIRLKGRTAGVIF